MSDRQRDAGLRVVENRESGKTPPPHDAKIEAAILGSVMVQPALLDDVIKAGVKQEHFYTYTHRVMYRALVEMHAESLAIDHVTLESYLRSHGSLAEVGGPSFIANLFDTIPTGANWPSYVTMLGQLYRKRCREASAIEAVRLIQSGDSERAEELLRQAAKSVDEPLSKPDPKKREPAPVVPVSPRAATGELEPLEEGEYALLVRTLRPLRKVNENPGSASRDEMLAALVYLAPFENGLGYAARLVDHEHSLEALWLDAVSLYERPDRAGAASMSQKIIEHAREDGREDIIPISHGYGIYMGQFVKRKLKFANGEWTEETPLVMTNFTCWVVSQDFQDDGTGAIERTIRIGGQMAWGETLPEFTIPAGEWTEMSSWLHTNWGHKVVVFSRRENGTPTLEAIALYSMDAPVKTVYTHAGWTKVGDKNVFITANGAIGLDGAERVEFEQHSTISLGKTYARYRIPTTCTKEEAAKAYQWLERFLHVSDLSITAPVFSALFLAPLASMLRLSFILGYFGPSDSRKSSLVAAAMTAWGREFDSDHLTMSFLWTANRIENEGFYGKDLPLVVDNYVPTQMPDHHKSLMRLAHTIGDSHARGRMLDGHRTLTAKPIRGMMIVTGEENADKYSSGARMYAVPMNQTSVNLAELTELQIAGQAGKLEPAMTHYLTWLAGKMDDPAFVKDLNDRWFTRARAEQQNSKDHGRFAAQRAWINIGLELARESHPRGRWNDPTLDVAVQDALDGASSERGHQMRKSSITHTFINSIKLLIDAGHIVGVDSKAAGHPPSIHADVFGWTVNNCGVGIDKRHRDAVPAFWVHRDESENMKAPWFVFVNVDVMLQMFNEHIRNPMEDSANAIGAAFEGAGMLWLQPSQRGNGARAVSERLPGGVKQRVLRIRGPKVIEILDMGDEQGEQSNGSI